MSFERDNIRRMQGYASGEQPDDDRTVKLNTNESPYPPAPAVQDVLNRFDPASLRRYPPPTANAFRDIAAKLHDVQRDNLIATRGGDELLRLLITTFVDRGEYIAMSSPTYSLYPVLAQIQDCPILQIPLEDDWSLAADFCQQVNAKNTKLTLIVNPHAPSGRLLNRDQIAHLAANLDSVLLIDEAYIDFVDPDLNHDCLSLIQKFDNLVFLRTLSKGYGLAGLRFGYGIGKASLIQPMLEKTRDSYNLDLLSQTIACAALQAQDYAQNTWQQVRAERQRMDIALHKMRLAPAASQANFLLTQIPASSTIDAASLYLALKDDGILVRYFDQPRLCDKLRLTIGTREENDQLLACLAKHLA
ncbi:MAG: histidinol-phosphate aminotransferase [Candidatus Pseudothioglobus sp.]|jgi:histidinol-phosphate aminotransferase